MANQSNFGKQFSGNDMRSDFKNSRLPSGRLSFENWPKYPGNGLTKHEHKYSHKTSYAVIFYYNFIVCCMLSYERVCIEIGALNLSVCWWFRRECIEMVTKNILWYPFLSIPFTCYAFIFSQTKNALIKMWIARNLRFQNWQSDIFFCSLFVLPETFVPMHKLPSISKKISITLIW